MGVKEKVLTAVDSITSGDFLRVVTSAGYARKIDYNKLAKAIVENYAGSSLAGSSQSLKAAIDSLNSNIKSKTAQTIQSEHITEGEVSYLIHGGICVLSFVGAAFDAASVGGFPKSGVYAAGWLTKQSQADIFVQINANGTNISISGTGSLNAPLYGTFIYPVID